MPEEKNDQQSADAVKREDYNKVVESHNSLKAENEEMKRKLDEIASKMKVNEERELWKTHWHCRPPRPFWFPPWTRRDSPPPSVYSYRCDRQPTTWDSCYNLW